MTVETTQPQLLANELTSEPTRGHKTAVVAGVSSFIIHACVAYFWQAEPIEPLTEKPPQIIEVAIIKPEPLPVIKPPVEPPKPPEPVKPVKVEKPKPSPKPKPVPVAPPKPPVVTPPQAVKAPPKVVQKTEAPVQPEMEDSPEAKVTAPVLAPPPPKVEPTPAPAVVPAAKPAAKPSTESHSEKHGSGGVSSGVVPLERVQPKYPSRALSRHIEGHVTIEFTITPHGSVTDARIVSATPEDIFDEAALDAIRQWKFKQKIVNGEAVEQRAVQTLQFKLANEEE